MNLSESGSWLCNKHPMLRALVEQIGSSWDDGSPVMHHVRDVVIAYDGNVSSNLSSVRAFALMFGAERACLRMLATLAPNNPGGPDVQFCVRDMELITGTDEGRALVEDYLRAVRIGVLG